ncbi:DUF3953 domain-containing protein [Paenibacillus sp. CMAA1739]|uniref:DUF3953 domain-containing protein n=1 Tax=Paenibacillus ottowii TaxID=2315729 RepID=UPI00273141A5|nr:MULTISPECIES: DUF3953 domain-containing protein [Paenibacillus]MDP1509351.1 DUF3953 domain-containing protein [Paenibacillus ottowii]MEC4564522.1 DUF3953 domain-containing protein [Paenibacillus sp. CMAA1739]
MLKKMSMYQIATLICALVVLICASLSFAYPNDNQRFTMLNQLFLGLMLLFSGISELKAKRMFAAIANFGVSLFIIFVMLYTL